HTGHGAGEHRALQGGGRGVQGRTDRRPRLRQGEAELGACRICPAECRRTVRRRLACERRRRENSEGQCWEDAEQLGSLGLGSWIVSARERLPTAPGLEIAAARHACTLVRIPPPELTTHRLSPDARGAPEGIQGGVSGWTRPWSHERSEERRVGKE